MALPPLVQSKSLVARAELEVKRAIFDCRGCGQCLLSQCGYICPMQCPKGLRNGPCGGMNHGHCEVYPDANCIWTNIHIKLEESQPNSTVWSTFLRPPVNPELFGTSSWQNFMTGSDRESRAALPLNPAPVQSATVTPNAETANAVFETLRKLSKDDDGFIVTSELRTPHKDTPVQLKRRIAEASALKDVVDALSCTAHADSMAPEEFCKQMNLQTGVTPMLPLVGRDRSPDEFHTEVPVCVSESHAKILLCLSGDYAGVAPFPMDSAQLLHTLKGITWDSKGEQRPLLGAALHPQAQPRQVALKRAVQKTLSGADIFFTQLLLGTEHVAEFIHELRQNPATKTIPIVLGIPLIGSAKGFAAMEKIPGLNRNADVLKRFQNSATVPERSTGFGCGPSALPISASGAASNGTGGQATSGTPNEILSQKHVDSDALPDPAVVGSQVACELVEFARSLKKLGVVGVHIMPFGLTGASVAAWIKKHVRPTKIPIAVNIVEHSSLSCRAVVS
jgi:5,10-methylenetetrahydrofolate reductase